MVYNLINTNSSKDVNSFLSIIGFSTRPGKLNLHQRPFALSHASSPSNDTPTFSGHCTIDLLSVHFAGNCSPARDSSKWLMRNNKSSLAGLSYVKPNGKPQFAKKFPCLLAIHEGFLSFYGYVRSLTIADCISGPFQESEI